MASEVGKFHAPIWLSVVVAPGLRPVKVDTTSNGDVWEFVPIDATPTPASTVPTLACPVCGCTEGLIVGMPGPISCPRCRSGVYSVDVPAQPDAPTAPEAKRPTTSRTLDALDRILESWRASSVDGPGDDDWTRAHNEVLRNCVSELQALSDAEHARDDEALERLAVHLRLHEAMRPDAPAAPTAPPQPATCSCGAAYWGRCADDPCRHPSRPGHAAIKSAQTQAPEPPAPDALVEGLMQGLERDLREAAGAERLLSPASLLAPQPAVATGPAQPEPDEAAEALVHGLARVIHDAGNLAAPHPDDTPLEHEVGWVQAMHCAQATAAIAAIGSREAALRTTLEAVVALLEAPVEARTSYAGYIEAAARLNREALPMARAALAVTPGQAEAAVRALAKAAQQGAKTLRGLCGGETAGHDLMDAAAPFLAARGGGVV